MTVLSQTSRWDIVKLLLAFIIIIVPGEATGGAPAPGASEERSPECEVISLPQHQVLRGQEIQQPQHQEERLHVCQAGAGERLLLSCVL